MKIITLTKKNSLGTAASVCSQTYMRCFILVFCKQAKKILNQKTCCHSENFPKSAVDFDIFDDRFKFDPRLSDE